MRSTIIALLLLFTVAVYAKSLLPLNYPIKAILIIEGERGAVQAKCGSIANELAERIETNRYDGDAISNELFAKYKEFCTGM